MARSQIPTVFFLFALQCLSSSLDILKYHNDKTVDGHITPKKKQ